MKTHFLFLIAAFFWLLNAPTLAQKQKKKLKQAGVVQLNDTTTAFSQTDIFLFPNVNKVFFHKDEAALKQLKVLSGTKNEELLYKELKKYIQNFGIENFNRNTAMIWELAKLSQKYGKQQESLQLYKLALRHHVQGINVDNIFKEYDSIETDKKELYVPLEHYYELVNYRKDIDTLRPPQSVLVNMGEDLNSRKEDYGPTIGNVDNILLFTSKRNQHDQGIEQTFDEDLFFSIRIDGYWNKAKEFSTINSNYNEGSACLSQDGKLLLFSRCNATGSLGHCDLYAATLNPDSVWGNVQNLGPMINSAGWDSHPSLSHSGDTLFFASNRIGGFGLSDIYYSVKAADGNWQKADNAGPVINTRQSEVSPFFHHRFNILYFSSNGHPLNFGEFDIYKSVRLPHGWSDPKNIGPLVNGGGSEYYFTIDSKSKELYYARSHEQDKRNLDLYSFPVPMEAQPEAVTQLKGSVKSEAGQPMRGIVSIIDLDEGVEVAPKFLREDGTFDFSLINKRNYLLIIQGDEFFRIEEIFFLNGEMEINKIAEPIETKIAFKSLEFEHSKSDILPSMTEDLNKMANFLIDHPGLKLRISGHTDSAGKEEANRKLSQDRADAIKNYLVDQFKIDSDRITAIGYGSLNPIVEEKTEQDKQLNRRVEFEILRE